MFQQWLQYLYTKQESKGKLRQYMAFCLTKMDLPEYNQHIGAPRNFSVDKLGRRIEESILKYCVVGDDDTGRVEFFATSAIGMKQGTKESNLDKNTRTFKSEPEPINLLQPFEWILENIINNGF